MSKRKKSFDPAENMQNLVDAKQQRSQQTPAWPGARERAEPQRAHARPPDEPAPQNVEQTPPSESGYERNDINKRHH
jgi:hypothetical protein